MTNIDVPLQHCWLRGFQPLQITPPTKTSTGLKWWCCQSARKQFLLLGEQRKGKYDPLSLPHLLAVHLYLQLPRCTVSVDENRQAWQLHWLSQRGQLEEAAACSWVEKGGLIISSPLPSLNVHFHFDYRGKKRKKISLLNTKSEKSIHVPRPGEQKTFMSVIWFCRTLSSLWENLKVMISEIPFQTQASI